MHAAFGDPEVKAVSCIRGGYAAGELLDRIDYKLIERNPKIFIGYSDITAMHLAIHKLTGLVTFHGPVTTSPFTPYTQACYKRALFGNKSLGGAHQSPRIERTPAQSSHPDDSRRRRARQARGR